jgi:hypothetical protein
VVEVAKASRDAELSQMQVVESGSVMALGMRHGDGGVWVQAVVVFDQLKIRHPGSSVGRGGDWTARARVLADDSCAARTSFGMMLGAMVDVDQRHRRRHRRFLDRTQNGRPSTRPRYAMGIGLLAGFRLVNWQ